MTMDYDNPIEVLPGVYIPSGPIYDTNQETAYDVNEYGVTNLRRTNPTFLFVISNN
jgi:hypothetical protein